MKFLITTLAILVLSHSAQGQVVEHSEQARSKAIQIQTKDNGLSSTLRTFNDVADTFAYLVNSKAIDACAYHRAVLGMANSVEKRALNNIALFAEENNDIALVNEAIEFSGRVSAAMASECSAANDKCCKHSNQADVSDSCNTATTKNCTLVGVRIQGCTTASDDC